MGETRIVERSEAKRLGLKQYFTGRPCKHGHIAKRTTVNGICVTCGSARSMALWRSKGSPKQDVSISRRYRMKDHEAYKARIRKWARENPERIRESNRNREATKKGTEGRHTADDIKRIFDDQGGMCAACKVDVSRGYHVDHIHPLSRGGSNWPANLQILCPPCNLSKNDSTMEEWQARGGFGVWGKLAG